MRNLGKRNLGNNNGERHERRFEQGHRGVDDGLSSKPQPMGGRTRRERDDCTEEFHRHTRRRDARATATPCDGHAGNGN